MILGAPGRTRAADPNATVVEVDHDGTVRYATGPDAQKYTGTRIHTLTARAAATVHETLEDARFGSSGASPAPSTPASEPAPNTDPPAIEDYPDPTRTVRELTTVPLILRVLDRPELVGPDGRVTRIETEQAGALLTILALRPDGIRTRDLLALEWPGTTDDRRSKLTLSTAITRIRTLLHTALDTTGGQPKLVLYDKISKTYRLNPGTVTTDLALTHHLTHQAEAETGDEQLRLLIQAAALHRRQLAGHLDDDHRGWLTTARYTVLTETTALHLRIAEITTQNAPDTAARHLITAVDLAPEDAQTVIAALQSCRRMNRPDLARALHRRHSEALRALGESPNPELDRLVPR